MPDTHPALKLLLHFSQRRKQITSTGSISIDPTLHVMDHNIHISSIGPNSAIEVVRTIFQAACIFGRVCGDYTVSAKLPCQGFTRLQRCWKSCQRCKIRGRSRASSRAVLPTGSFVRDMWCKSLTAVSLAFSTVFLWSPEELTIKIEFQRRHLSQPWLRRQNRMTESQNCRWLNNN